jgi:7,8-dihydroneopterin aldolase/epimerase/oxygenase
MLVSGDHIVLAGMTFLAAHGVNPREKVEPQRFEVDVELWLDLRPAAAGDDLAKTVDYRPVYDAVRTVVEGPSVELIETLAERIARGVLASSALVDEVVVRVRKPDVALDGPLDFAGVEVRRRR